jgi:hypothetical protein
MSLNVYGSVRRFSEIINTRRDVILCVFRHE